jgi:hypothetical protein
MQVIGSWRVPPLGAVADAALPPWLVDAMTERKVAFSDLGGLRFTEHNGEALPGDAVILTETFEIQFCPNSTRSK